MPKQLPRKVLIQSNGCLVELRPVLRPESGVNVPNAALVGKGEATDDEHKVSKGWGTGFPWEL